MPTSHTLRTVLRATARMLLEADVPARPARHAAPPIVLVHGFGAASAVLGPLARHLERRLDRPVLQVRLGGAIPLHLGDVRATARAVQAQIEDWIGDADVPYVDVVGHSLGGLVATYLLKVLDRGRRVRKVVTLGTPHRGTWIALAGALVLGAVSRAIWQMIPGSPLLRELRSYPVPERSELIALESDGDALVPAALPAPASPGVSQVRITGVGHVGFLTSRAAFSAVQLALA